MVGAFQFTLGLLRLGVLVNFLSHPVINGFTNAAALIIVSSQLPKMFGVQVDSAAHHYVTVLGIVRAAVRFTHGPTLLIGVLALAIMFTLKRLSPKIPNVLAAVLVTSLIAWGFGFQRETTAALSALHSQAAGELIAAYNRTLAEIPPLEAERVEVNRALSVASDSKDLLAVLQSEHAVSVLTLNIARLKNQVRLQRGNIRTLLFRATRQADGTHVFVPWDSPAAAGARDGPLWRLKVGGRSLQTDRLRMSAGGEIVGSIPRGFPPVALPAVDLNTLRHLLPFAAIISLLGFMEAISVAKAMAAKTGQQLDPNQELIGQGLANICGALTHSHPTSGSFSRSAVNLRSGAVTGLSGVFTSLAVAAVLLFFTPLLYYLPQSALAAIIVMAVIDLINFSGFVHAWRAQWYDGAISVITFVSTLVFAPHLDKGIFIGVALSLMVFLYKSMRPAVVSLSLDEDDALHDSVSRCLLECRFIAVVRFDGPLFFANANYLEAQINQLMVAKQSLRHIIILANNIYDMDATGEEALSLVIDRVRSIGIDISLCGVNRAVMAVLQRTHLIAKLGEDHLYPAIERAIAAVHAQTHSEQEEAACPLTGVCRLS
jgi:MFS superfamily sulfate permease-like transporter